MDRGDLDHPACRLVLAELFGLMRRMQARGAAYSSWYGAVRRWPSAWEHINRGAAYEPFDGNPDELRAPWFLLWEIVWVMANTPMAPGARVLDMGGAGSLFSSFLAHRGCEVQAIDLDEGLCQQARRTAAQMGWRVEARQMDMTRLAYPDGYFDHVFSICVLEHLPVSGRIACGAEAARVLRPGGTAAYTFDYGNPQSFGRLDTAEDVLRQLVEPSRLRIRGGTGFEDSGLRQLDSPQAFGFGRFTRMAAALHSLLTGSMGRARILEGTTSYTFGALFLEKLRD